MMVVEHSRGRRVAHEVLQDIITGYEEHLPFAREMVTNIERMTTAEREAFIAGNSSRVQKNLSCSRNGTRVSLASEQILPDLINPQGALIDRIAPHCRRIKILQDDIPTVAPNRIVVTGADTGPAAGRNRIRTLGPPQAADLSEIALSFVKLTYSC
jgi:hypothetical protein